MKQPVLQTIQNDHVLSPETDGDFLQLLERAVLLALLEEGALSQMHYRYAEERLRRDYRWGGGAG